MFLINMVVLWSELVVEFGCNLKTRFLDSLSILFHIIWQILSIVFRGSKSTMSSMHVHAYTLYTIAI